MSLLTAAKQLLLAEWSLRQPTIRKWGVRELPASPTWPVELEASAVLFRACPTARSIFSGLGRRIHKVSVMDDHLVSLQPPSPFRVRQHQWWLLAMTNLHH
jgi:hypothetical protein